MRKLWQWFHSLPGCLPSFCFFLGLLRPTTAWHGNEMGGRGRWRQRTDIKRQAQLDPATIVRCGHPPSCRASEGCGRSDSSGLLAHPWHPSAAGSTDKGPFSLMTCVTADGYLGQGEGECTQRHRSAVALGVGKKEYCLFSSSCIGQFRAQTHLDRKLQWNIQTMHSRDSCGNQPSHMHTWERTHDGCM